METWGAIAFGVTAVLMGGSSWHVLLARKAPSATLLWLVTIFLVPVGGVLLYVGFGVDRLDKRATFKQLMNKDLRLKLPAPRRWREEELPPLEADVLPDHLDPFATTLANLARYQAVGGNSIEAFFGGDVWYPRALRAIDEAEHTVLLQSYIFQVDGVGTAFLQALRRASRRGVRCHLLYDGIGSLKLDLLSLAAAEADGVETASFSQRDLLRWRFQINLRNHRKILVVDGCVGFTGGMNITDDHVNIPERGVLADDHHFEVRGPVCTQLSAAFAEDWYYARGEKLSDPLYFPDWEVAGDAVCRIVPSGPDGDRGTFHHVVLAAVHSALERVQIVTPYFLPDDALKTALVLAALRGVLVEVVVPEQPDHPFVGWAMGAFIDEQVAAGVRILRRPAPFLHSKLLAVDGKWALVGSGNLDARSFWLNYELCLSVAGEDAVRPIVEAIDVEIAKSEVVDPQRWRDRGAGRRAWENFWALWSPLL
jgi:cardiolipin synthase A/B